MTEHDERERDEDRPKVRVVDKRRFGGGGAAPAGTAGAASPAEQPDRSGAADAAPQDELAEARTQAAEYRDHLQRLQADFENFRKRTIRSQERLVESELQRFVQQLLEVLDEFDLALIAAERSPDFESFRKGVELVYAKLADTLRSEGLERIAAEGKPFDPNEHEALMQTGEGDGEPHVAEVFRQGYKLRGSVIRPASVRVERE
ncbi:MAG TPA: nucleotide exchange factor GrpE [Actinomycetota bacterium]|jgi:molecular chaperone GrpE|nr:nucleotide exchange factor GrpE [Actinomycetota bacterium]